MKVAKGIALFGTFALAIGLAESSAKVTLYEKAVVGGKELKPGEYQVKWDGSKASIKAGKETIEAPAKTETGSEKYDKTAVRYSVVDGKYRVEEIRLGGTNTKLVFDNGAGGPSTLPAAVR
jgi:hypothetical protein